MLVRQWGEGSAAAFPIRSDDPATGNLVVQFSAASGFAAQFQPGDMVVIRGFISPTQLSAIEKQFAGCVAKVVEI